MATNINQVITRSLHRQLTQVAMQQNEDETIIRNYNRRRVAIHKYDALQFHTLKKVQYIMSRIPKIEE
jgi:hypothetical protein